MTVNHGKQIYSFIAILLFCMWLQGCSGSTDGDFNGIWKAVKITQNELVYVDEIEEYGLEIVYNLKDDHTFTGILVDTEVHGTYKVNDTIVLFTYENGETDSFTLEKEGLIGEAGDMKIVLEKQ